MRYDCPNCEDEYYLANTSFVCWCGLNLSETILDVEDAEMYYVTGTTRKAKPLSAKKIKEMYREQEGKCAYCFAELNYIYHLEHIKPLCVGGTNKIENMCISCPRCNLVAGAKVFDDFFQKQKYILDRRIRKGK